MHRSTSLPTYAHSTITNLNADDLDILKARIMERTEAVPNPEMGSDCWFFDHTNQAGYGLIWNGGKSPICCHVALFEIWNGPLPDDPETISGRTELDHLCARFAKTPAERHQARSCCNPKHLEPVTRKENLARVCHPLKTVCKYGHPLTRENRTGGQCKICRNSYAKKYRIEHPEFARRMDAAQTARQKARYASDSEYRERRKRQARLRSREQRWNRASSATFDAIIARTEAALVETVVAR